MLPPPCCIKHLQRPQHQSLAVPQVMHTWPLSASIKQHIVGIHQYTAVTYTALCLLWFSGSMCGHVGVQTHLPPEPPALLTIPVHTLEGSLSTIPVQTLAGLQSTCLRVLFVLQAAACQLAAWPQALLYTAVPTQQQQQHCCGQSHWQHAAAEPSSLHVIRMIHLF